MNTAPKLIDILVNHADAITLAKEQKNRTYVIYARKSTDGEDKQVRSLTDQVIECQELAKTLDLTVAHTTLMESESAKESNTRPIFRQMIEDLKRGKYHGILAWHPDRLARNMKEAGEIIDLLDKGIIADLKFPNFSFENSSSGKVTLGITFVLAKDYSDKLSENVKRGIKRSLHEGKYVSMGKLGYFKDAYQFLRPDENNFLLLKNAFKMRLNGDTLESIAEYLNTNGFQKHTSTRGHYVEKMDPKKLSRTFRDPVYTGTLMHGDTVVDLKSIYNFTPIITEEEFLLLNKNDKDLLKKLRQRNYKDGTVKADFLRGIVTCGHCSKKMVSSITTKTTNQGKKALYYYYRCDTKDCVKKGKSVRPRVIIRFIEDFIQTLNFKEKRIYQQYVNEMEKVIEENNTILKGETKLINISIQKIERAIQQTKEYLLQETDLTIQSQFKSDLKIKLNTLAEQEILRDTKIRLMKEQKGVILSYSEFLKLFHSIGLEITKTTNLERKNFLIKKIFSNFTLKEGKVSLYTLQEPFHSFQKEGFLLTGRGDRT